MQIQTTKDLQIRYANILIVEDESDILLGLEELLNDALFQLDDTPYRMTTVSAVNGYQALQIIEKQKPDLIISDVRMPLMSGFEFLEKLRENSQWMHIPFIFLTAKNTQEAQEKGRLQGANLYITKPFDPEKLLQHIISQLQKSFALQKAQQSYFDAFKKHVLQILNHEFRTPLTYVTAYYEMLADGVNAPNDRHNYQEYLHGIQAGCVRLSRLIEDFMLVISLYSGEAKREYQQHAATINDLTQLVQESIDQNRALAEQNGVDIRCIVNNDIPPIWGLRSQIANIFTRLINNAIKFSSNLARAGVVTITLYAEEDEICIQIKDNGTGMPAHIGDEIFELFYQYDRATQEQQGIGVGLTIATELANINHGTIKMETEDERGTIFTLSFVNSYNADIYEPQNNHGLIPATILAIEDDPHLLDGLKDLLETMEGKYQLEVLTATNGLEGLEVLQTCRPDLIISDIMMPYISGYDFLYEVRKNPEWLQIPVIFLTAKGKPPDKHKAYIMGVDEYITKPYDSHILLQFVEAQLDRRFRMQQLLNQNFEALKKSILNLITPNFRQPLTFVSDYTAKLTDALESAQTIDEVKDSLHGIQTGSQWLQRLIEDFMALAEMKTGEAKDAFEVQAQIIPNIGVLISEFALIHSPKLEAQSEVKLTCLPMDTQIARTYGNVAQISTSVSRLIEVGVKYCVREQTPIPITLSAQEDGDWINIDIQFTAVLPADVAQSIHDTIRTADDNVELRRSLEYGPDLSIAYGYISLHQGMIHLTTSEPSGFMFRIQIPVYRAAL